MKACLKSNYSKDLYSNRIDITKLQANSVDELIEKIYNKVARINDLATNIDDSKNPDDYNDSIDALCQLISSQLSNANLTSGELSPQDKTKITKTLKGKFLPEPLTKAEKEILAIVKNTDLVRDEDVQAIRYNGIISDFYGSSNPGLDNLRLTRFREALRNIAIYNKKNGVVESDRELNNGIINYLEEQYQIIRKFIKNYYKDIDTALFPQHLFTTNNGVKVKTQNHFNTLTLMYNIIESMKEDGKFMDFVTEGWNKNMDNSKEQSQALDVYNAANAYINIVYFDDTLKKEFSKFIDIGNQANPIQAVVDEWDHVTEVYKYTRTVGNSNARKTWGDEISDALNEMSKFHQVLIESIPMYDHKDKTKQWGNMEPKDLVGSFTLLKAVGTLVSNEKFRTAVEDINNSKNNDSLNTIFKILFKDENQNVIRELNRLGLDYNHLNILYSVYKAVFADNDSWKEVEEKFLREKGIHSRYNLVETILNTIKSNTILNYLQTTYDYDTDQMVTAIKERFSYSKSKFDIIHNINDNTIQREDTSRLLETYKLKKLNDDKSYSVEIGETTYNVIVTGKEINILSKKGNIAASNFEIKKLDDLKNVDISSIEAREKLLNMQGLTTQQDDFIKVLDFIDKMLGTSFSKSEQSLNELYLATKGRPTFFHDVFMSAVRALVIQDIYNDFRQATKQDGSKYAKNQLKEYIKNSNKFPGIVNTTRDSDYFLSTIEGYQLKTVDTNEQWIVTLAKTRALLNHDTIRSVISDLDGNKNPNFSLAYLSGDIKSQMRDSNDEGKATRHLLFSDSKKRQALLDVAVDMDVAVQNRKTKQVKAFTERELISHAIIDKFLIPFSKDRTVFIQSTTQSDKTKFIADHIDLFSLGLSNLVGSSSLESTVIDSMMNTIGAAYKDVYNEVISDYEKLFPSISAALDKAEAISNILRGMKEQDLMGVVRNYNKLHPDNRITIYKDTHYRKVKGGLAFNELLYEYATNLYNDKTALQNRLKQEKQKFLKNIFRKHVLIKATDQIKTALIPFGAKDWVKNWTNNDGYLILAKNGNIPIYRSRDVNETTTLNPFLNAFFLIDNLIGNNLRLETTGSEINHLVKSLGGYTLIDGTVSGDAKTFLQEVNKDLPNYEVDNTTFYELKRVIDKGNNIEIEGIDTETVLNELRELYNKKIQAIENLGQNAQFKRNVIMSATMNKITPNLEGISPMLNVACMDDITYNIFNFSGKGDRLKVHDGSALIGPLESILENKSLGSNEVGYIKKPIQHSFSNKYMTATLLKYATDTMTNQWMRQSVGNDLNGTQHAVNLFDLFKKMHNKRWHKTDDEGRSLDEWVDGKIDLIYGCEYKDDEEHEILFRNDILQGHNLYYKKNDKHYRISNFGIENGIYYTVESEVSFTGSAFDGERGLQHKVYHYFDKDQNHIPSETLLDDDTLHTIDSLFELHTALGSIWTEVLKEGNLVYSESSNIAVVNYMNYVATLKPGGDPKDFSINSYDQPLKRALIHVVANDSAVKNGAGNINSASVWTNNEDLEYMQIDAKLYGIQQNSDHTADEAKMTEFSQVISSLDAGGYMHDYVAQVYQELGQVALDLSQIELESVEKFRKNGNLSDLYDIVGRTLIANIKSGRNQVGLSQAIMNNIRDKFNLNTDHSLDEFKIPFSDPNIYSNILSTFVSNMNKKSIKRQFPGLGTVMVPSFNISMIFDINGQTYQFEDVLKEAQEAGFVSAKSETTDNNKDVVRQYLYSLQEKEIEKDVTDFYPTDNVLVTFEDENGILLTEHISLNGINDYYKFTDNPQAYLENKGYTNISNLKFYKDVTVPRNLAPAKITWDYKDSLGTHHINIFNHWRVKGLVKEIEDIKAQKYSKALEKSKIAEAQKKWNVDQAFKELKEGHYQPAEGAAYVNITNLQNAAAEIIMSNIYSSKFNMRPGDSLIDVMKEGQGYFQIPTVDVYSNNYDMVFTKGNGNHTFITFKPLATNTDNCSSFYKSWGNINKKSFESSENVTSDSPRIVNRIYAVTNDNVRLFEIGREIVNNDVVWDSDKKAFIQNGKKVKNPRNFRRDGDRVLEYIEFVSKHTVTETYENGSTVSYDLFNINKNNIKRCYQKVNYPKSRLHYKNSKGIDIKLTPEQKYDQDVNYFISDLLADIYKSNTYSGVQFNKQMTQTSGRIVKRAIYHFADKVAYNKPLYNYLREVQNIIDNIEEKETIKIPKRLLNSALRNYNTDISKQQYTSFQKSLYFTAARIPAQTLQSFMKQKCVGFTGVDTGQCFVSAWQTYLQGSDYK